MDPSVFSNEVCWSLCARMVISIITSQGSHGFDTTPDFSPRVICKVAVVYLPARPHAIPLRVVSVCTQSVPHGATVIGLASTGSVHHVPDGRTTSKCNCSVVTSLGAGPAASSPSWWPWCCTSSMLAAAPDGSSMRSARKSSTQACAKCFVEPQLRHALGFLSS